MDDAFAAVDASHLPGDVAAVLRSLAMLVDDLPAGAGAAASGRGAQPVRARRACVEDLAHPALATGSEMPSHTMTACA